MLLCHSCKTDGTTYWELRKRDKFCCIFQQFAEQYCEEDIGDLAHEDIEGFIRTDSERVDRLVSQFEKQHRKMYVRSVYLFYLTN